MTVQAYEQPKPAATAPIETRAIRLLTPDGKDVALNVEIADTDQKRIQGLMFRRVVPANTGMLFLFPKPASIQFWMKNTLIPLDMLFFDKSGKIVHVEANARPLDLTPRGPSAPITCAVLEIAGGEAARLGLIAGGRLDLPKDQDACLR